MLKLVNLTKSYLTTEVETLALRQVSLEIDRKSTRLNSSHVD